MSKIWYEWGLEKAGVVEIEENREILREKLVQILRPLKSRPRDLNFLLFGIIWRLFKEKSIVALRWFSWLSVWLVVSAQVMIPGFGIEPHVMLSMESPWDLLSLFLSNLKNQQKTPKPVRMCRINLGQDIRSYGIEVQAWALPVVGYMSLSRHCPLLGLALSIKRSSWIK